MWKGCPLPLLNVSLYGRFDWSNWSETVHYPPCRHAVHRQLTKSAHLVNTQIYIHTYTHTYIHTYIHGVITALFLTYLYLNTFYISLVPMQPYSQLSVVSACNRILLITYHPLASSQAPRSFQRVQVERLRSLGTRLPPLVLKASLLVLCQHGSALPFAWVT